MESSTPFPGSGEIYDWICGFINMERGQSIRSFRLDRMKILAGLTGHPENCAPAFHTAGSKGKGSVTAMIAAILNAAGRKCSLYASPHVMDFRERISLGKVFFEENVYGKAGSLLRETVETLVKSTEPEYALFNSKNEDGEEPTFFELMTLWFFLCSRTAGVDSMAVETGMGGRLDATNILDPLVSVITLIELEHTEYLGSTIEAIAGEKAGIIKKERPVIISAQKKEALDVFRKKAAASGSPVYYFPEWGEVKNVKLHKSGTDFSLNLKNPADGRLLAFDNLHLSVPAEVQAFNAGLAVLAVKTVYPDIPEEAFRKGLDDFTLPARFERLLLDQDFIVDGAHTPGSIEKTVDSFLRLYGKGGILIFGCAAGKDAGKMASILYPDFSKIIITTPGTFKKSSPLEIYEIFKDLDPENRKSPGNVVTADDAEIMYVPDTGEAVSRALELGKKLDLPILGTGSFYLAAEIRKLAV